MLLVKPFVVGAESGAYRTLPVVFPTTKNTLSWEGEKSKKIKFQLDFTAGIFIALL